MFNHLTGEENETQGGCYLPSEVNIVHLFLCPVFPFCVLGIAQSLILSNGDEAGKASCP